VPELFDGGCPGRDLGLGIVFCAVIETDGAVKMEVAL
jgi:hypothetical protein